ncbi:hypothetical protein L7F22_028885 [Adiantum nelumboides]|nr:hypothetical protein [Adiantum nelumboides]
MMASSPVQSCALPSSACAFPSRMHPGMPNANILDEFNDVYNCVIEKIDADHSGTVDLAEFGMQMRDILLAIVMALAQLLCKLPSVKAAFFTMQSSMRL